MYLILGELPPALAESVRSGFDVMGVENLSILDLFSQLEIVWRLDSASAKFELHLEKGRTLGEDQLLGVIALEPSIEDNTEIKEKEYFRAEKRAALLAWLSGLKCPVVNRISPMFAISSHIPLALWRPALTRCGLSAIDAISSNLQSELKRFVSELSDECDYVPLSADLCYRVATADDLEGLARLTQFCPIHLTQRGLLTYAACVIDRNVFWNQPAPATLIQMQDRLIQLAAVAKLSMLEIGVLIVGETPRVCSIDPFPKLDRFRPETCDAIAKALLSALRSD
jgi:hypothetical protein